MRASQESLSLESASLSDENTLEETLGCLLENLPLAMSGEYGRKGLFEVLLQAASERTSIEQASKSLRGVPQGNTQRYHLEKFETMSSVQGQLNATLQSRLPRRLRKGKHRLAIDLHLLPYYGVASEAEAPYILRSAAKSGTTRFYAYATLYVIRRHQRFTLAIHAVHRQDTWVAILTFLLAHVGELGFRINRLYLDRGFYSVPVIRWLKALNIPFLMPAIIRGKQGGTRALCQGRRSYATDYTLRSSAYGKVECHMHIVCTYLKGRRHRHGVQYSLYVSHRMKAAPHAVQRDYRHRFGIESSYRLKNVCRIRSTTKNPVLRLLFVTLAFIIVNVWIYLLWQHLRVPRAGGSLVFRQRFPLKMMLTFLRQAIERRWPPICNVAIPLAYRPS